MTNLVITSESGKNVTTSLMVANVFGKRNSDILRDIDNLSCSQDFRERNFALSSYITSQNRQMPMYEITKDGFSFLVMGYTGEKAGQFKETFINEFNKRDALLNSDEYILQRSQQILTKRISIVEDQLQLANSTIKAQAPMVETYKAIHEAEGGISVTEIAKELGFRSPNALNEKLKQIGVQRKVNGCYVLNLPYSGNGYEIIRTTPYFDALGRAQTSRLLYWTEKGRIFIHGLLSEQNKIKKLA